MGAAGSPSMVSPMGLSAKVFLPSILKWYTFARLAEGSFDVSAEIASKNISKGKNRHTRCPARHSVGFYKRLSLQSFRNRTASPLQGILAQQIRRHRREGKGKVLGCFSRLVLFHRDPVDALFIFVKTGHNSAPSPHTAE